MRLGPLLVLVGCEERLEGPCTPVADYTYGTLADYGCEAIDACCTGDSTDATCWYEVDGLTQFVCDGTDCEQAAIDAVCEACFLTSYDYAGC